MKLLEPGPGRAELDGKEPLEEATKLLDPEPITAELEGWTPLDGKGMDDTLPEEDGAADADPEAEADADADAGTETE